MKAVLLLFLLTAAEILAQGPLAPPAGAPAAGMRTLEQIEPRTPIPKSPVVPIAGPHFTITQPGSYYLTGNVEVASGDGIVISSGNVTLDLNGFALISKTATPAAGSAILLSPNLRGVEVKNGRITGGAARTQGASPWQATFADKGWEGGIISNETATTTNPQTAGILLSHLTIEQCYQGAISFNGMCNLQHIAAVHNGNNAIDIFGGSVDNVTVSYNGGNGLNAFSASVSNVTASYNKLVGIYLENGSATNSAANFNGGGYGMYAESGTLDHCVATGNAEVGLGSSGGVITGCRARANGRAGISTGLGVAAHCVASGNSTNPSTVDKEINVSAGGQRDACVPATE